MNEKQAHIRTVEEIAPGLRRIELEMHEPPAIRFRAGQFVSVRIGDGFHPRRSYSIASSPGRTGDFELLAKTTGGSADGFLRGLQPGSTVRFLGPMGFFSCDEQHPGDVVMAATGVGISAILSMLEELAGGPEGRRPPRMRLFWGLPGEGDVVLRERLDRLVEHTHGRFEYAIHLENAGPDWTGHRGFITDDVVATADALDQPTYYLCGNGAMIRDVTRGLRGRGVPGDRIRYEVFYPAVWS